MFQYNICEKDTIRFVIVRILFLRSKSLPKLMQYKGKSYAYLMVKYRNNKYTMKPEYLVFYLKSSAFKKECKVK